MPEYQDRPPPLPPLIAVDALGVVAFLLAWMRGEDGDWMGLITWVEQRPGAPGDPAPLILRRSRWLRAGALERLPGEEYDRVPRVRGVWRPYEDPEK
ncbi:MAG: hypothetical protein GEV11_29295 [Streptosporangiales bacterium]|nr:hypothetical protein [Streptosporangiales bacterium]